MYDLNSQLLLKGDEISKPDKGQLVYFAVKQTARRNVYGWLILNRLIHCEGLIWLAK